MMPTLGARRPPQRAWRFIAFALACAAIAVGTGRAQEAPEGPTPPPGVQVSARLLTGIWRPAQRWNTAIFELRNDGGETVAAECTVRPETPTDASAARTEFALPPRSRRRVFLSYWAGFAREVVLEVRFPGRPESGFTSSPASDITPPGAFVGVLAEGAWSGPQEVQEDIIRVRLRPADMPEQVEALDPFDCIHWIDPVPGELCPAASDALARWIQLGGHLLVETAEPGRLAGLPAALPEMVGEPVTATRLGDAPAARPFAALRLGIPGRKKPARTELGTDPATAPMELVQTEHGPVAVTLPVELGRLTVAGWRQRPDLPDATAIYRRLLRLPPTVENQAWAGYEYGQALHSALSAFPVEGLPGISSLVAWVLLYVAVVGPLEWWCLRRLRRPVWTWWTCPLAIAGFAALLWHFSGAADVRPVRTRSVQFFDVASGGSLARVMVHGAAFYPDPAQVVARIAAPDAELSPRKLDWGSGSNEPPITYHEEEAGVRTRLSGGELLGVAGRWTATGPWIEIRVQSTPPYRRVTCVNRSPYDWGPGRLFLLGGVAELPELPAGARFDVRATPDPSEATDRPRSGWLPPHTQYTSRGRPAEDDGESASGRTVLFIAPVTGAPCPLEFSGAPGWEERFDYVRCWVEVER